MIMRRRGHLQGGASTDYRLPQRILVPSLFQVMCKKTRFIRPGHLLPLAQWSSAHAPVLGAFCIMRTLITLWLCSPIHSKPIFPACNTSVSTTGVHLLPNTSHYPDRYHCNEIINVINLTWFQCCGLSVQILVINSFICYTYQTRPVDPPAPQWPGQSRPASPQHSYICLPGAGSLASVSKRTEKKGYPTFLNERVKVQNIQHTHIQKTQISFDNLHIHIQTYKS